MKLKELEAIAAKMTARRIKASYGKPVRKMTPAILKIDVSDDAAYWSVIDRLGVRR